MSSYYLIMPSMSILMSSMLTLLFETLLTLPLIDFPLAEATEPRFSFKLDAFLWLWIAPFLLDWPRRWLGFLSWEDY